uniref:F-box domain-containing protein n=1 Tax=Oryza barthii TaxID=65489 RepID=A0A0D3H0W4_9ORYZ
MEINNNFGGAVGLLPSGFGKKPWLVQAQGTETLSFVDILDRSLHVRVVPDLQGKLCLGCVHGGDWLLMVDEITGGCFLFCLSNSSKVSLPPLREPLGDMGACVVLGSSPLNRDCTVVITSLPEPEESFLLHCHPGDEEWTKLMVPLRSDRLFGKLVNCSGQLYSLSSFRKLLTIDSSCGHNFEPYLVESCGELFVVLASLYGYPYNCPLNGVSVYRLDQAESMLRRVDGIGTDRAFLISGHYGFSCAAMEGLVQGNCVYIVWSGCDCERIYMFCLDDMTISLQPILPHPTEDLRRGFWSVPAGIEATKLVQSAPSIHRDAEVNVLNNFNKHEDAQATIKASWQDLPIEMLELTVSNLSLVDRLRFPSVCKQWSSVSNPVAQAKVWPWLMHCVRQDGACKMFDPLCGVEYTMKVGPFDANERHAFRFSKDGWVIVTQGDDSIFVINPFTKEIVKLSMAGGWYRFTGISFSSVPTSPDCVFLGVCSSPKGDGIKVWTCRPNEEEIEDNEIYYEEETEDEERDSEENEINYEEEADQDEEKEAEENEINYDEEAEDEESETEEDYWSEFDFENDEVMFPVACNNPVYFRGEFYFLEQRGNLSVFNPGNNEWRILDKPEPIHADLTPYDEGKEACYMVELRGELIAVFHRNANESQRVLKLDESKMEWVEIEDIGGGALFLDYRASIALPSSEAGHGNRIYFPKFSEDGKQAIFYDMEAKKYSPMFYEAKEPMNCVWFVPKLQSD